MVISSSSLVELGLDAIRSLGKRSNGIFFTANHFADQLREHKCPIEGWAVYDVVMREVCPWIFYTHDLTSSPGMEFLRRGAFDGVVGMRWQTREGQIGNIWYTSAEITGQKIRDLH